MLTSLVFMLGRSSTFFTTNTSRADLEHVPEALLDSPRSSHTRTLSLSRLLKLLQLGLAELHVLILHPLELLVLAREPEA